MTKLKYAAVVLAAGLTAALCALIPGQANALALTLHGPPVTSVPGPYYNAGDLVGICVAQVASVSSYVEVHTSFGTAASPNPGALGNCAAGRVQLVVVAVPPGFDGAAPAPSPSASP